MINAYIHDDCLKHASSEDNKNKIIIIPHICNNIGGYGAGFVAALNNKWSEPREHYLKWHNEGKIIQNKVEIPFKLGEIQLVKINNVFVVNMISQNGTISTSNKKPIKYAALVQCLTKLKNYIEIFKKKYPDTQIEIHAPKFGSGLAGGNWDLIEELINEIFHDDSVYVYVFP
jgi:hypothetical protein